MQNNYSREEILDFLKKTSIMSAAFANENKPISTVLLFGIDDDFTIYFATHENTYKAKAIIDNPQISISVWEHKEMMIQADGKVSRVTDNDEVNEVLNKLVTSADNVADFWPPVLRIKNETPYFIGKIKLSWLRATDLVSTKVTEKDLPHTEIKF